MDPQIIAAWCVGIGTILTAASTVAVKMYRTMGSGVTEDRRLAKRNDADARHNDADARAARVAVPVLCASHESLVGEVRQLKGEFIQAVEAIQTEQGEMRLDVKHLLAGVSEINGRLLNFPRRPE